MLLCVSGFLCRYEAVPADGTDKEGREVRWRVQCIYKPKHTHGKGWEAQYIYILIYLQSVGSLRPFRDAFTEMLDETGSPTSGAAVFRVHNVGEV